MLRLITVLILSLSIFAQGISEIGIREKSITKAYYTNADVYVDSKTLIKGATILVENGAIVSVKKNGAVDNAYTVIDLKGKMVYPGFIDVFTQYGVKAKKGSGRAPNSDNPNRQGLNAWNGTIHAELNWYEEFKANAGEAKSFLRNGFTVIQSARFDGIFRGQSFIVLVGEGIPNDLVLKSKNAHFLSFNNGAHRGYPGSLMGRIALVKQTLHDAIWYRSAQAAYQNNANQDPVENNAALAALANVKSKASYFDSESLQSIFRADKIFKSFKYPIIHVGSGYEYTRIADLKKLKRTLVMPIELPKKPNITTIEDEINVTLADLRHWDRAKTNLAELEKAGITFAITSTKLTKSADFLKNLRQYVDGGLSKSGAIKALTETPAALLGMSKRIGKLKSGMLANFIIVDGDLFDSKTSIQATVVQGKLNEFKPLDQPDIRADYSFNLKSNAMTLKVSGTSAKMKGSLEFAGKTLKVKGPMFKNDRVEFSFSADTLGLEGMYRFAGRYDENVKSMSGYVLDEMLGQDYVTLTKSADFTEEKKEAKKEEKKAYQAISTLTFPNRAFGVEKPKKAETVLYKNFTVWTSEKTFELKNTDVLIQNGKIKALGKGISAPRNARVIDGKGKYLTAGIIDQHSHIAAASINEWHTVSAEVHIGDNIDGTDISIYRQLAGGVTTSQILHGSANPIGGQSQVIKLRWGKTAEELKYKKSAQNIKFALGENVKRNQSRYPNTRMGVETAMRDAFIAALEYKKAKQDYAKLSSSAKRRTAPVRYDVQKESLLNIIEGRTFVHCHSYVQSEIIMLMRLAEEFGFRIHTFTHILEGYKVADEMREHGAMGSTFADWWAYKYEVKDAMAYNPMLMTEKGVITSVNSDDAELGRRLNLEAAKSIVHGGMSVEDAWAMVTMNPAKQLQVEKYTGSIKVGKEADIVVWSGNPLSGYSRVEATWVDGVNYFSIEEDQKLRESIKAEKLKLLKKVKEDPSKASSKKPVRKMKKYFKCESMEELSSVWMEGGSHE